MNPNANTTTQANKKTLLSIVELGGYPNFTPLYEQNGYQVVAERNAHESCRPGQGE